MTDTATTKAASKTSAAKAKSETEAVENVAVTETEEVSPNRIPDLLSENSLLAEFCRRYLVAFDEISEYNKNVLAAKNSEWNVFKVLAEAKKMAYPESGEANKDVLSVMEKYEAQLQAMNLARKAVIDAASDVLGISLSAVADKDPETESQLKEKRKLAVEIGKQLSEIAKLTTDTQASDAVTEWLNAYELPVVGRDQTTSFTENSGKGTAKHRVTVKVIKDGNELLVEDGFTKSAAHLSKPIFGYDRGKSPKSDELRQAWEKVGNTAGNTVQDVVEFEDNGLTYIITKK